MALLVSLGRFQAQRNGRGGGLCSPHEMYSEEIKLTELFLQNGSGYEIATKCGVGVDFYFPFCNEVPASIQIAFNQTILFFEV